MSKGIPEFISWGSFPEVPKEKRPMILYHAGVPDCETQALVGKGWELVDVRLMPDARQQDRQVAIMAWLSGIRLGSILVGELRGKMIENEMRMLGLLGGRSLSEPKDEGTQDIEQLLKEMGGK